MIMHTITAELVDGCQLHCELCWNRNRTPSGKQMSLETVAKILARYKGRRIDWFNWGEPLLHKQFVQVAELIRGTKSCISTNLSLPISDETLNAMQLFRFVNVSLSGMSKEVYGIYHHGGDFNLVMFNLNRLANHRPKVNIRIRWLDHKFNQHHKKVCEDFCVQSGFGFGCQTLNCEVEDLVDGFEHELLTNNLSSNRCCRRLDSIVIGVDGQYLLCCASHNVPIGYTIDDDIDTAKLLDAKNKLPLCKVCQTRKLWKMF
jgi:MoaA/NifB/PqqE/SkfB family radical SAM enzyme